MGTRNRAHSRGVPFLARPNRTPPGALGPRRLALHEPREQEMRQHPLANHRPAQRSERRHRQKSRAAHQIDRQVRNDQRAVQYVDAERAEAYVGAPVAVVARQRRRQFARIGQIDAREAILQIRDVAQAKVQALRADRRKNMAGFTHESDAAMA